MDERRMRLNKLERALKEMGARAAGQGRADAEIERITREVGDLRREFYAGLGAWQRLQLSRHPQRPYTLDYVASVFTDFHELHGDRMYADDMAIVGGPARLDGHPVMVIGHQKGRDTKERVRRNYGMPSPRAIARHCA